MQVAKLSPPPQRDYTCVTQRRKALLFCCVLTTWLLKVASERFTVGGSELRVTMYAAVIMNDRFCAKKHVCSFIESEVFSDNWEFRWTRWNDGKKEVEVNVNWGDVNGVESILHNIFKVNIIPIMEIKKYEILISSFFFLVLNVKM